MTPVIWHFLYDLVNKLSHCTLNVCPKDPSLLPRTVSVVVISGLTVCLSLPVSPGLSLSVPMSLALISVLTVRLSLSLCL